MNANAPPPEELRSAIEAYLQAMQAGTPHGGSSRSACIAELADWAASIERGHAVRIALDGPDAAGKTTLAAELADALRTVHRRPVVLASVDDFHAPAAQRHRRGRLSPDGYYEDAFDHRTLRSILLDPLGPGGDGRYRTRAFDLKEDRPVDEPARRAEPTAIVLVEGVFLQRAELAACWDARVWITASEGERMRRALEREAEAAGSEADVRERYLRRYLPAGRRYAELNDPADAADVLFDNEEPHQPRLHWR